MKYSFTLDKPKSDEKTFVFVMGTFGDRLKYSLKEKIHPDHWDPKHQRPLPATELPKDKKLIEDLKALKSKLDRIQERMDELIRESKRSGIPLLKITVERELDYLMGKPQKSSSFFQKTGVNIDLDLSESKSKKKIEKIIEAKIDNTSSDFFQAAVIIIWYFESGEILTDDGKHFSWQTITNYMQSVRNVYEFKPKLKFSEIDMNFYRQFIKDMNKKDLSLNSQGAHIKCLKRILSISLERGWHNNPISLNKDFRTPGEDTEDIALTEEELTVLFEKKLLDKGMELARDWFILDSYTGLRISDIQRLNTSDNLTKNLIIISNEKTDAPVHIPLHPKAKAIIKKWKGFPPRVTDQHINREIKKVAELCKINDTVLYTITKGGKRNDTYYKKYEMISNHTARRSFITNLRKNGVPDSIVMKLAGIVKPATLAKYDKLTSEEAAKIAAKHSFFNG